MKGFEILKAFTILTNADQQRTQPPANLPEASGYRLIQTLKASAPWCGTARTLSPGCCFCPCRTIDHRSFLRDASHALMMELARSFGAHRAFGVLNMHGHLCRQGFGTRRPACAYAGRRPVEAYCVDWANAAGCPARREMERFILTAN